MGWGGTKEKVYYANYYNYNYTGTYRWDRDEAVATAAAPPAAAADADDDARASARVDADAQNAGEDWVHRMHLHHLRVWVAVVHPLGVVVVAHRRWPDTMAAVNRHRSDPVALQPAQALAVVRPVHPAPVAHNDDPVALCVHHSDAVLAVAEALVRHDTRLPLLLPVDSDAHGLRVPHALPHTDDAGGAYATLRHHRRQVAPTDGHDRLQPRRQQQLQQPHTMVAAVHDDPVACAPYADPSRVHDTSLH